ncbi:MAG: ribonuclease D [Verrucomicrobiae bacterium]|nr:ribonuclease D [Verrucomicrobiae bacterium]
MIARETQLLELADKLRASPWVAMDTEADSLHAYPEKICLIQISYPGRDVLVDPLAGFSLQPLWEALHGRELIMHGCDYDLRLLRRTYHFLPGAVFDTMLAARLLGYQAFGLSDLVARHLGVRLEKGPQKANWALRPLPPHMEQYARNDSRHLKPLADILRAELVARGRLEWHREMCARLLEQSAHEPPADADTVWRVKGCGQLDRRGLAVLRAVWHWREHEATAANRPPFFILSTDGMISLAALASAGQPYEHLIPRRFSPARRERLRQAVDKALHLPPEKCPAPAPRRPTLRLTAHQRRLMNELQARRDALAARLQIDPTLIAPRATLVALATDGEAARRQLMTWQQKLLF